MGEGGRSRGVEKEKWSQRRGRKEGGIAQVMEVDEGEGERGGMQICRGGRGRGKGGREGGLQKSKGGGGGYTNNTAKVDCIHIQLNHMPITKIHLLPTAMTGKGFLQILSARTSLEICPRYPPIYSK